MAVRDAGRRVRILPAVGALAAIVLGIRLVTAVSGPESSPAMTSPAAGGPTPEVLPEQPATVTLPPLDCSSVDGLSLANLTVGRRLRADPPHPDVDLDLSACGGALRVTVQGDALLSGPADGDVDWSVCTELMRETTVDELSAPAGTTFCAVQRTGTSGRYGWRTVGRVTVSDTGGALQPTLLIARWILIPAE